MAIADAMMADRCEELREENDRLRIAAWAAYIELNTIRARDGVPYTRHGWKSDVSEEYFSSVVEFLNAVLGEDAKPWPAKRWLDQDGSFSFPALTDRR